MLNATQAKAELRRIHKELGDLVAKLDHTDHDIARDVHAARSDLFAAWSKARMAEKQEA